MSLAGNHDRFDAGHDDDPLGQFAAATVYEHLRTRDDNPCVVIPTAGGKTPVMASMTRG
jgi:hypothetical protein